MAGRNYIPFKRSGTDRFSKHASCYEQFFREFTPLAVDALAKVKPSFGQPFVIADYGTADGLTSRHLVRACIGYIRKTYDTSLPVTVIYEDQPINDFTPIFQLNAALIPGERSFTEEFKNVYVLASGTSFYQQCLPSNSIDFLICCNANHWLSQKPGQLKDAIFSNLARGVDREAYVDQSNKDLETFLLLRAKELRKGGCMVMINSIEDQAESFCVPMNSLWKILLEEGKITQEIETYCVLRRVIRLRSVSLESSFPPKEFLNTNFCFHGRSKETYERPFWDENSSVRKAGLRLVSTATREFPSLFSPSQEDKLNRAKMKDLATKATEVFKAWSEKTFWDSLGKDRTEEEKETILKYYYSRLPNTICEERRDLGIYYAKFCTVIQKC